MRNIFKFVKSRCALLEVSSAIKRIKLNVDEWIFELANYLYGKLRGLTRLNKKRAIWFAFLMAVAKYLTQALP